MRPPHRSDHSWNPRDVFLAGFAMGDLEFFRVRPTPHSTGSAYRIKEENAGGVPAKE
jgi:hypothetical protein